MPEENRWGEVVKASNDKGPYKLVRVQSDGQEVTAMVAETYGIQGSPMKGGQAFLVPVDGDEGKMIAFIMPPPAKRIDGLKEGEVAYVNHDTNNMMKHDADGNTTITTPSGTIVKCHKDGNVGVKPGSGKKVYLGDVDASGMSPVVTVAGPSSNVMAKV